MTYTSSDAVAVLGALIPSDFSDLLETYDKKISPELLVSLQRIVMDRVQEVEDERVDPDTARLDWFWSDANRHPDGGTRFRIWRARGHTWCNLEERRHRDPAAGQTSHTSDMRSWFSVNAGGFDNVRDAIDRARAIVEGE